MKKIHILDCTLRDGGYINKWQFGESKIRGIIKELDSAGIDIVECGFLRDVPYDKNAAVFSCVSQITPFITPKRPNAMYVAMIALGDIAPEKILPRDESMIDGIRLTFHKHEWNTAKVVVRQLMEKGYEVFVQPVGTTSYTDAELLRLIDDVNTLHPFAFYLVDTLGQMYQRDLFRLSCFIDHNLDSDIVMGFHSHNNLQLSIANALDLIRQDFKRNLIIDASVYGMGRGVGNLPTELLTQYINENVEEKYQLIPLLVIAERYLMSIYAEQRWGYDLPYFLSAVEKCHPNYASFLMKKETLNIEVIAELLRKIPADKKELYHREIIEKLYLELQDSKVDDSDSLEKLDQYVHDRKVLLLAPGSSIETHKEEIRSVIEQENAIVIAVNFMQDTFAEDIVFISNQKRLNLLKEKLDSFHYVIATSNLGQEIPKSAYVVNYSSYLGEGTDADNAGAMLIRLLTRTHVKEIMLAGFDGFVVDVSANYYVDSFKRKMEKKTAEDKNNSVEAQLRSALKNIPYRVITPTKYKL